MNVKNITYQQIIFYTIIVLSFVGSLIFVNNNYSFYDRSIAEVIETSLVDTAETVDRHNNEDRIFTQQMKAKVKNGHEKNQIIHLTNEYSLSGAYDQEYKVGNELFVWIDQDTIGSGQLKGIVQDVKRDKHLLPIAWVFIFVLMIIGKRQGLFAIISLIINALLLSYALDIYIHNSDVNLLLICGIIVVLFTVISLLLVNGFDEKTYAAIVATILATFISLLVTYVVIWFTSGEGLRYEAMDFLTRPYKTVFFAGLFVGSLGAVMDVAITISASIFELYDKNNDISVQALKKSGLDVGKDIMGTMTSILFFAYMSGSIPILILYLKNSSPFGFALSLNLSLELTRALAGGIGIVLTIPIGLYTTIFFVKRKKARL